MWGYTIPQMQVLIEEMNRRRRHQLVDDANVARMASAGAEDYKRFIEELEN